MRDIFNAKELLYSLREMDRDIKDKLEKLDDWRSALISLSVSTDKDCIQTSSDKDKLSGAMAKIVDLENEINAETDGLIERRKIAKEIIFNLPSEENQNILYEFYICNKPLWSVADEYDIVYNKAKYKLRKAENAFKEAFDNRKTQHI